MVAQRKHGLQSPPAASPPPPGAPGSVAVPQAKRPRAELAEGPRDPRDPRARPPPQELAPAPPVPAPVDPQVGGLPQTNVRSSVMNHYSAS